MVITYHGAEFFKVTFGDTTLAFNPVSKDSKLKGAKFGADVAFLSLNHPDMNGVSQVTHGEREPLVIQGPGEYEVSGIFARGYASQSHYGKEARINTVYILKFEGMKLCYLGATDSTSFSPEAMEMMDDIDILFLPIGGEGVLEPAAAHSLAVKLEPKLIIPMHFGDLGVKDALKVYLKEEGSEAMKPVEKLTLKKKDLEGKNADVVVLEAR